MWPQKQQKSEYSDLENGHILNGYDSDEEDVVYVAGLDKFDKAQDHDFEDHEFHDARDFFENDANKDDFDPLFEPHKSIIENTTTRTGYILATGLGALASYGFVCYAKEFFDDQMGDGPAWFLAIASGIPLTALSGSAGGPVLSHLLNGIAHGALLKPGQTSKDAMKSLFRWDLQQRDDLGKSKLAFMGLASFLGLINLTPFFSIFASMAVNYKRSYAWWSTAAQGFSAYFTNTPNLKKFSDSFLNYIVAWRSDTGNERVDLLRMFDGLRKELEILAKERPAKFIEFYMRYQAAKIQQDKAESEEKAKQYFEERVKICAELYQYGLDNVTGFANPEHYQYRWSIPGILMLIPAVVFAAPLFKGGDNVAPLFSDTPFIGWFASNLPAPLISYSSLLSNVAINSINAYAFIELLTNFKEAIQKKDWSKVIKCLSELGVAALPSIAQYQLAYDTPLMGEKGEVFGVIEAPLVALGSELLYAVSMQNFFGRMHRAFEQMSLRSKIETAECQHVLAYIEHLNLNDSSQNLQKLQHAAGVVARIWIKLIMEGEMDKLKAMSYDTSEVASHKTNVNGNGHTYQSIGINGDDAANDGYGSINNVPISTNIATVNSKLTILSLSADPTISAVVANLPERERTCYLRLLNSRHSHTRVTRSESDASIVSTGSTNDERVVMSYKQI